MKDYPKITHKRITIPNHVEPIRSLGGVYGPILTPYVEKIETIALMVADHVEVYERVNGQDIKLDYTNYDKFHGIRPTPIEPSKPVAPPEPPVTEPEPPVTEPEPPVTEPEPPVEGTGTEEGEEETQEVRTFQQKKKKNK